MSKEQWIVELTECDNEIWGSDIDCGSREEAIEKGMGTGGQKVIHNTKIVDSR